MKKIISGITGLLAVGLVLAEDVSGLDRILCSAGQVSICFENGECFSTQAHELGMPDFVIIDTDANTISTTKASGQNRSSPFSKVQRVEGALFVQGMEGGRAFSIVIDEATGLMTAAVSRDGVTVTAFGACTDADVD